MAESDFCEECIAAGNAEIDDAVRLKSISPQVAAGAFVERLRRTESSRLSLRDDSTVPSILREYHYSFLRIFVYNLIGMIALAVFLWAMM